MRDIADCRLCLLFTPSMCLGDPWQTLRDAVAGGVDLVQWRVKEDSRDGLERCVELCAELDVPLLVNDDVALAIEVGAAGAHVGQDDLTAAAARELLGELWLGVSTHSESQAEAAIRAGADYLGIGPCFATATKGYTAAQTLPREVLAAVAHKALPTFAIGGITAERIDELRGAGVRRVAVSGTILGAERPAEVARALIERLHAGTD